MTRRRTIALVGAAFAVVLVLGRLAASAYTDWAWHEALGAEGLWRARILVSTQLLAGLFLGGFAFAVVNLLAMRFSIVSMVLPRQVANLHIGEVVPGRKLTWTAILFSALIAASLALSNGDWLILLRAQWATPIGEIDAYLGRDIAFWIAWLPLERMLRAWCVVLAAIVGVVVMLLYALTPSIQMERGRLHVSTWVRRHFALYSAILLLLVAWGYRLDAYGLLLSGSGGAGAFARFDHQVLYPYLIALSFGTAGLGVLVAWTGWVGHQRAMFGALLLAVIAGPLGRVALPLLEFRVMNAREQAKEERPYREARILYSRRAFGIDEIERGPAADSLRVDVAQSSHLISGWDPAALAESAMSEFGFAPTPGAGAWLVVGGDSLRAIVPYGSGQGDNPVVRLTAHVLDPADADARGNVWPAVADGGATLPPLLMGVDVAPVALITDTLGHVAAPLFGHGWQRLALSWGVRRLRLALDSTDDVRTRLVVRRGVEERVRALFPFFTVGATHQAVVAHDSLWWTLELFHANGDFPLSAPISIAGDSYRYAVPAGLAVINAHSGRTVALVPRHPSPMTRWWRDHLPSLFVTPDQLDRELLAAFPPPVDRASIQASALAATGLSRDSLALHPLVQADNADPELRPGSPTPFVSGAESRPLAWAMPAVDGLNRMRGLLVAVGGARARTAFIAAPDSASWSSMLDQLQRTADSAHISQSRRYPRRGRVQVIPTTTGTLATQSFYEWAPERAPVLTGVVALHQGDARAAPSLSIVMGAPARVAETDQQLRLHVTRVYAALQEALRRGDWVAFGRAMEDLKRLTAAK